MKLKHYYDVAVIGAGIFGAWIAHFLEASGRSVLLADAYGPANSRASSAGETRIIRMGYGADDFYTRWSARSFQLWQEFLERIQQPLFHRTGVLWLAAESDEYTRHTADTLARLGIRHEKLRGPEIAERYPQINAEGMTWALLELDSGALMARQAVQAVVRDARQRGVEYMQEAVLAPSGNARPRTLPTAGGQAISAEIFVFACGPWLPGIFPGLLAEKFFITRQEVFFFGPPPGSREFCANSFPAWICLADQTYGIPDIDGRGFKVAYDRHGAAFDPDSGSRVVPPESAAAIRKYVAERFPALRQAPIVETRVCQYENTSNGDFLIDRHPVWENVWLVGGGSGHGFKHGPAVAEYVCQRIQRSDGVEARFSLATKASVARRAVF